jgi:hypothetical protein
MTIDSPMLGAVRHYLRGPATVAALLHMEMKGNGGSIDSVISDNRTFADMLEESKQAFLKIARQ